MPFESPDWESLTSIRELNLSSQQDATIPAITICSGRPLPYVEAVGQWLGVRHPLVFESGGGIYDMQSNELHWSPGFGDDERKSIAEIRKFVEREIIAKTPGSIAEFSKMTDVGIIHKHEPVIIQIHDKMHALVEERFPGFEVHRTEISVNCILSSANKGEGLRRLSELVKIPLAEIAYIGDSSGDIPALKAAGLGYCPQNAIEKTKQVARVVNGKATAGVLEAYREIVLSNRSVRN